MFIDTDRVLSQNIIQNVNIHQQMHASILKGN
jgi:hypothetical protein